MKHDVIYRKVTDMKLGFITSNIGKFNEIKDRLEPLGHEVIQLSIEYPEIQAEIIDEVSRFGIEWIISIIKSQENSDFDFILEESIDLIFVEDSGIFVNSLGRFPGVYSKFVFRTLSYSGVLKLLLENTDRSAVFESCIAATIIDQRANIDTMSIIEETYLFRGVCNGNIVQEPRGNRGFGYDPIFQPEGANKTFAEMDTEEKNKYSHRGKAVSEFIQFLNTHF